MGRLYSHRTGQAQSKSSICEFNFVWGFECVTEHCTSALSCLCLVQLLKTCSLLIQASDYAVSNALRFGMGKWRAWNIFPQEQLQHSSNVLLTLQWSNQTAWQPGSFCYVACCGRRYCGGFWHLRVNCRRQTQRGLGQWKCEEMWESDPSFQ